MLVPDLLLNIVFRMQYIMPEDFFIILFILMEQEFERLVEQWAESDHSQHEVGAGGYPPIGYPPPHLVAMAAPLPH
eukprot:SAG31_NODE_35683_length_320_cov_2.330317_1_plen_76_part_00